MDGFRIDVSDALIKDDSWVDTHTGDPIIPKDDASPVHEIYRRLRRELDAYPGDRMAVIETGAEDHIVSLFLRPDQMHLAFNFRFALAGFDGPAIRLAIDSSLAANALVGAPTTWVTDNHDTPRSVTRLARGARLTGAYVHGTMTDATEQPVDLDLGTRRARALPWCCSPCPAPPTSTTARSWDCPTSTTLPTTISAIRSGPAADTPSVVATAAACPCRGPRRDRTSASRPRRSPRGCRSRLPGLH